MSEIRRVVIRTEHADGTVREYRLPSPAGTMLRFTDDGRVQARNTSGERVAFEEPPFVSSFSRMSDLGAFITARLGEDEAAALNAVRKRYPRWRVWLRRLRYN